MGREREREKWWGGGKIEGEEKKKEKSWKALGRIKDCKYLKVNKSFPVCLLSFGVNSWAVL